HFSPIVSNLRVATTPQTSVDVQVDYDKLHNDFRDVGVIGGLNRDSVFSGISYFFTKPTAIESAHHQLRGTLGYGNQKKKGISAGLNFSYDIQHSLFQGSTAQVGYNADCYGLSFEYTQFDIGARKESSFRFALSLKSIGTFGTIRPRERIF